MFTGLSLILTSALSFAAGAHIDPALHPLMRGQPDKLIRVVVKFKDQAALPELAHSATNHRAVQLAMMQNARVSQKGLEPFLKKRAETLWLFNSAVVDVKAGQLKALARLQGVESISANRRFYLSRTRREESVLPSEEKRWAYGLKYTDVPALLARFPNLNGQGVRVGVIDTGIDGRHPALRGRVEAFKDYVNDRKEAYDDQSHGTHISGVIAGGACHTFQLGYAPAAKLVVAKVFDAKGSTDDATLLKAMQWMADPDGNPNTDDFPSVVNNSWGGGNPDATQDPGKDPMCQAVSAWVKLGMLPVFAAGNLGPDPRSIDIPSGCPAAVAVGASDTHDNLGAFSGRGPAVWKTGEWTKPLLAAPGVKVLSTIPGSECEMRSGTSIAAPHVAGAAALLYQARPDAAVEAVVKAIANGADKKADAVPNNDWGYGRLNALGMFEN